MTRLTRRIIASLLSLSFAVLPVPPAKACAPDLAYAILINGNHPDMPLKLFAGGNLGIVQPGWAKSYLVVTYRYLSGKPLSKAEQESVVRLWHDRIMRGSTLDSDLYHDPKDDYLALRCKALGENPKSISDIAWKMDPYVYENGIGDSAFKLARLTLANILTKYAPKSQAVKDWIKAQDGLFGIGTKKTIVPAAMPASKDAMLQDARVYQIAAANFYLKKFEKAASLFQTIAEKPNSKLKNIASYMVLRSKSNQILRGDGSGDVEAVSAMLQKAADNASENSEREKILNLLRPISYLNLSSSDVIKILAAKICAGSSKSFGSDLGDLTFLLDGNAPLCGLDVQGPTTSTAANSDDTEKKEGTDFSKVHDLADFVCTMQRSNYMLWDEADKRKQEEEGLKAARHAREMWQKTKSQVWLLAALSGFGVRLQDDRDLYLAAMNTPENSPAFLTCRFYLIDSLIAQAKRDEARKLLKPILSATNLPPTARNLFSTQMAAASQTLPDYLRYSVLNPPEILDSSNDLVSRKFTQCEAANVFQTQTPALDTAMARDLSRNAPLSTLMTFAKMQSASSKFKPVIVRTAWTRAQILQRSDLAATLENDLASSNPTLVASVNKIKNAPAGLAKQFAVACLILRNYGMSPYLMGGAERHGESIGVFDYYNNNFWVPMPLKETNPEDSESYYEYNNTVGFVGDNQISQKMTNYASPGVGRFLNEREKKAAVSELQLMLKNHPSRFFGQTVLDWAKLHPHDPDVPEMLFRVVKLPKWTQVTPVGSEFSKKAYFALHKGYPGNPWTKKAVCYY